NGRARLTPDFAHTDLDGLSAPSGWGRGGGGLAGGNFFGLLLRFPERFDCHQSQDELTLPRRIVGIDLARHGERTGVARAPLAAQDAGEVAVGNSARFG